MAFEVFEECRYVYLVYMLQCVWKNDIDYYKVVICKSTFCDLKPLFKIPLTFLNSHTTHSTHMVVSNVDSFSSIIIIIIIIIHHGLWYRIYLHNSE